MAEEIKKGLKKNVLTKEERRIAAKAVIDKCEEQGIAISPTKDGLGGLISTTDQSGDRVNSTTSDVHWMVGEDGYVHIAGVLPNNLRTGYDYLTQSKEYETIDTADRAKVIQLSRQAVKYEGVVCSSIEALVEIPTLGGWFIYCENEELEKLLYYWAKNFGVIGDENSIETSENNVQRPGGIELFSLNMLWSMYRDGDAVITEQWNNVRVDEVGGKRRNLPVSYMEHDVASCTILDGFAQIGKELIVAEPDTRLQELVEGKNLSELDKKIFEQIPEEIKSAYKDVQKYEGKYLLPPEFTTHFSRKTDKRSPWGLPYVIKAFPALAYKHRLRDLDNATIEGLIQRIWIVKIGHEDKDSPLHYPDNDRVLLAVALFKKLQSTNFAVWGGPDLETEEFNSSENNVLSFSDRYQSADDDVRIALGVPKVLLDGTGAGSSKDFSVYVKILSQMERYQIMIKNWIDHKMRQIAVENGYKDQFPQFFWMMLKTQDKERAKNVITKLWEDSLMGRRMSLNYLGFPSWMIVKDQQREKEEGLNDTIDVNPIPFTKRQNDRQDVPDGDGTNPNNAPPEEDTNRDNQNE